MKRLLSPVGATMFVLSLVAGAGGQASAGQSTPCWDSCKHLDGSQTLRDSPLARCYSRCIKKNYGKEKAESSDRYYRNLKCEQDMKKLCGVKPGGLFKGGGKWKDGTCFYPDGTTASLPCD